MTAALRSESTGTGTPPVPDRRTTTRAVLALLALHAVVQLLVRPAPQWADPTRVFEYARDWPEVPLDHHALRLGSVVPGRLAIDVLGYTPLAYHLFPLFAGLLLVLGVYVLGRLLAGPRTAFAAGLLIVLDPFLVDTDTYTTSWQLMPDMPSAAFFTIGLVAVLLAGRSPRRSVPWLLAAGLAFGASYLLREYVVFLAPAVLAAALVAGVPWRRLPWLVPGGLVLLAGEALNGVVVYDDPLARFSVASEHQGTPTDVPSRLEVATFGVQALTHPVLGVALPLLALAALVGAAVVRSRPLVLCAVWILSLYVPLTLLGGLIDPDTISLRAFLPRYWLLVHPPIVVGGLVALGLGARWALERWGPGARPALAAAGVGVLVLYAVPATAAVVSAEGDGDWRAVRTWLVENRSDYDAVWTDTRTDATLDLYRRPFTGGDRGWTQEIARYDYHRPDYPPPAADQRLVLVAAPRWGPKDLPDPGSGWVEQLRTDSLVVFLSTGGQDGAGAS